MQFTCFLSKLVSEIERRGGRVRIEGSAMRSEWKPGSDLDVLVYGKRFSKKEKAEIYDKLWSLNRKYNIGLENRQVHPPIFFVDNPLKAHLVGKALEGDNTLRKSTRFVIGKAAPKMKATFTIMKLIA